MPANNLQHLAHNYVGKMDLDTEEYAMQPGDWRVCMNLSTDGIGPSEQACLTRSDGATFETVIDLPYTEINQFYLFQFSAQVSTVYTFQFKFRNNATIYTINYPTPPGYTVAQVAADINGLLASNHFNPLPVQNPGDGTYYFVAQNDNPTPDPNQYIEWIKITAGAWAVSTTCQSFAYPQAYPIAAKECGQALFVLSASSVHLELSFVSLIDNSYEQTILMRMPGLVMQYPCDMVVRQGTSGWHIYVCDGVNPDRFFFTPELSENGALKVKPFNNAITPNARYTYDDLDGQTRHITPLPAYAGTAEFQSQLGTGGALNGGLYSYTWRGVNADGIKTDWQTISRPVQVISFVPGTAYPQKAQGTPVTQRTTKANVIAFPAIPTNTFPEIEVAYVRQLEAGYDGAIIGTFDTQYADGLGGIIVTHTGFEIGATLDTASIGVLTDVVVGSATQTFIHNRLAKGNIRYSQPSADLMNRLRSAIAACTVTTELREDKVTEVGDPFNGGNVLGGYNIPEAVYKYMSVMRGERYIIGARGLLSNGVRTDIVGFQPFVVPILDSTYGYGIFTLNGSGTANIPLPIQLKITGLNLSLLPEIKAIEWFIQDAPKQVVATGLAFPLIRYTDLDQTGLAVSFYLDGREGTPLLLPNHFWLNMPDLNNGVSTDVQLDDVVTLMPISPDYSQHYIVAGGTQLLEYHTQTPTADVTNYKRNVIATAKIAVEQQVPFVGTTATNAAIVFSSAVFNVSKLKNGVVVRVDGSNMPTTGYYVRITRPVGAVSTDPSTQFWKPMGIIMDAAGYQTANDALLEWGDTYIDYNYDKMGAQWTTGYPVYIPTGANGNYAIETAFYYELRSHGALRYVSGQADWPYSYDNPIDDTNPSTGLQNYFANEVIPTTHIENAYAIANAQNIQKATSYNQKYLQPSQRIGRVIYSQPAYEGSFIDGMLQFLSLDYYDYELSRGAVNAVRELGGELYVYQARGLWKSFFNVGAIQASGADVYIGNGNAIARDPLLLNDHGVDYLLSVTVGQDRNGRAYSVFYTKTANRIFVVRPGGNIAPADTGVRAWLQENGPTGLNVIITGYERKGECFVYFHDPSNDFDYTQKRLGVFSVARNGFTHFRDAAEINWRAWPKVWASFLQGVVAMSQNVNFADQWLINMTKPNATTFLEIDLIYSVQTVFKNNPLNNFKAIAMQAECDEAKPGDATWDTEFRHSETGRPDIQWTRRNGMWLIPVPTFDQGIVIGTWCRVFVSWSSLSNPLFTRLRRMDMRIRVQEQSRF
jgi:hypothetical protein